MTAPPRGVAAAIARRAQERQEATPYLDALRRHAARETTRLHVPGHKGGAAADPALRDLIGEQALRADLPLLLEGIDLGPGPTPFEGARRLAAEAWGAARTWLLAGGATQANQAACLLLLGAGGPVVVQRSAHSSTLGALLAYGIEPVFVRPEVDAALGIAHGVTPESVERALARTPGAAGVAIVSPTYYGAVADVSGIARVAHEHGVPLLVDEAWGSHLAFHGDLPGHALACGADLVVSSPHKTLGSLTGSALLHLGHGATAPATEERVDRALALVSSTSPSSLLLASLDAARRRAAVDGPELLGGLLEGLAAVRHVLCDLPGIRVLDASAEGRPGCHAVDPLRLTVGVSATGLTGYEVARRLRRHEAIELELAGPRVVVASFGLGERPGPAGARLVEGLSRVLGEVGVPWTEMPPTVEGQPAFGPLVLSPSRAYLGRRETVPVERAAGRVCAETIAPYPPGVPLAVPGERLTRDVLGALVSAVAQGATIRGASDARLASVQVVSWPPGGRA